MTNHLKKALKLFERYKISYSIVKMPVNEHIDRLGILGSFQCRMLPFDEFMADALQARHVYVMSATETHIRGYIVGRGIKMSNPPIYFVSRWVGGEIGVSSSFTNQHPLDFKSTIPSCNLINWKQLTDEELKILEESRIEPPPITEYPIVTNMPLEGFWIASNSGEKCDKTLVEIISSRKKLVICYYRDSITQIKMKHPQVCYLGYFEDSCSGMLCMNINGFSCRFLRKATRAEITEYKELIE